MTQLGVNQVYLQPFVNIIFIFNNFFLFINPLQVIPVSNITADRRCTKQCMVLLLPILSSVYFYCPSTSDQKLPRFINILICGKILAANQIQTKSKKIFIISSNIIASKNAWSATSLRPFLFCATFSVWVSLCLHRVWLCTQLSMSRSTHHYWP